jgi:uncharacterized protein YjlB
MAERPEILSFCFGDAGNFPNNPRLPVIVYKHAAPAGNASAMADWFEDHWPKHGWRAAWRWGVYVFPHYHSTAHEVLGVYRGHAKLRLGHTAGQAFEVTAGDVIVLPAGTVHQNLGSSADFHVVGGYPEGQDADLLRGAPGERPAADDRIAKVPMPNSDPILGDTGPLRKLWDAQEGRAT